MAVTVIRTRDGVIDEGDKAAFNGLKDRLSSGQKTVLLHLHGGLVSQADGEATAERLAADGPSSYNAPDAFEQVYVVWRTGLLETMRTNWRDLFENDRLYRSLFKRLLRYAASRVKLPDGTGRSLGSTVVLTDAEIEARLTSGEDAPFEDLDEILKVEGPSRSLETLADSEQDVEAEVQIMLEYDPEFLEIAASIASASGSEDGGRLGGTPGDYVEGESILRRLDPDIRSEFEGGVSEASDRAILSGAAVLKKVVKHAAKIGWRVIKRFRDGRHHGLHATIVEEILRELYGDLIGATIWGMMKTDAADHFSESGFGQALVEALVGSNHRVIVIGHSAGAIWAAEFLKAGAKQGSFPRTELHLLAPAIRTIEFAEMIAAAGGLISHFRIFTMSDYYERRDPVLGKKLGAIYPSSLLYVISGILEERQNGAYVDAPVLGMQRFIDREPDWIAEDDERGAINASRTFLSGIDNSRVYSVVDDGPGLSSSAIAHGDFDDDEATLSSIAHTFSNPAA